MLYLMYGYRRSGIDQRGSWSVPPFRERTCTANSPIEPKHEPMRIFIMSCGYTRLGSKHRRLWIYHANRLARRYTEVVPSVPLASPREVLRRLSCRAFGRDIGLDVVHRVSLYCIISGPIVGTGRRLHKRRGWGKCIQAIRTRLIAPSTTKSVPLTKLLSSLARKSTALACSMASPNRPLGKCTSRR